MFSNAWRREQASLTPERTAGAAPEGGFTLIELMVVMLIIAILLAIAIPTFLGVSGSANDRAAQSNLSNALTEAKALFENAQSYSSASNSFPASAPEFAWTTGSCGTTPQNCVSYDVVNVAGGVSANDGQGLVLAAPSHTGACWYAYSAETTPGPNAAVTGESSAGVNYSKSTTGQSSCSASDPLAFASWYGSYSSVPAAGENASPSNPPLGPACSGGEDVAPSTMTWAGDSSYSITGAGDLTGPGTVALRLSVGGVLKLNVVPATGGSISGAVSGTTYLAQLYNVSSTCYSAGLSTTAP